MPEEQTFEAHHNYLDYMNAVCIVLVKAHGWMVVSIHIVLVCTDW